jgi:hypothetical protein
LRTAKSGQRRQSRDGQGRRLIEGQVRRLVHQEVFGGRRVLGEPTVPDRTVHLATWLEPGDARADGLHPAGDIAAADGLPRPTQPGGRALIQVRLGTQLLGVERVHRRGMDPHEHFSGPIARGAVLAAGDRFHDGSLLMLFSGADRGPGISQAVTDDTLSQDSPGEPKSAQGSIGVVVDMTAAPTADLAVRKRQLVRSELAEAAVTLLADQAFVETTFDQIVAAVGMSRRTFSRY